MLRPLPTPGSGRWGPRSWLSAGLCWGPQGSARRLLPLTPAPPAAPPSQPTVHTASAQMILIKGQSREGFHSGRNCERVYYHVLLKSRTQGSRWDLFIFAGGRRGGSRGSWSLAGLRLGRVAPRLGLSFLICRVRGWGGAWTFELRPSESLGVTWHDAPSPKSPPMATLLRRGQLF